MGGTHASKRKLALLFSWLVQLGGARGLSLEPADKLGLSRLLSHVLVRSMGRGASAVLELLARLILFILALLLSWSPNTRTMAMQRVACQLRRQADKLQRLGTFSSLDTFEKGKPVADSAPNEGSIGAQCSGPPRVLVLGDRGVGGTAVIQALCAFAVHDGVELLIERGLRRRAAEGFYSGVGLTLIVWEASLQRSLSDYVAHHSEQLRACVGRDVPAVVVCNKTDTMPCPLPQIEGLGDAYPFIAVSAEKHINIRHLWEMVQPALDAIPAVHLSKTVENQDTTGVVVMEKPTTAAPAAARSVSSPMTPPIAAGKLTRRRQP